MALTGIDYANWIIGMLLEVFLCVLAIRRGLFDRLPFFCSYLILVVAKDTAEWVALGAWGYTSREFFYVGYGFEAALICARGMVIAELCQRILKPYRGVWALAWRLLAGLATFLLLRAGFHAAAHRNWTSGFILTLGSGLEFSAVGILVTLYAICRYYEIRVGRPYALIAVGLACYSAVRVLGNVFTQPWLAAEFPWWSWLQVFSFQLLIVLWLFVLRKPLLALEPVPALLPGGVYPKLATELNQRLRLLNQRLEELLNP